MSEEKKNLTVSEMIHEYLKSNDYGGLYSPIGECACKSKDLAPCGNIHLDCIAGYKISGDDLKCDCGFHISETKDNTDYACEMQGDKMKHGERVNISRICISYKSQRNKIWEVRKIESLPYEAKA